MQKSQMIRLYIGNIYVFAVDNFICNGSDNLPRPTGAGTFASARRRIRSKTRRCVSLLFALFLIAMNSQAFAIKPQPPLHLNLVKKNLVNGKTEVTLEARANMDITSAELSFELPESISLIEGEKQWNGPMDEGEKKTLTILVESVSRVPSKIIGKSTVHLPEGGSFVQQSDLILNPEEREGLESGSPPIKWQQGEETILEFKGK